jgi:hypothetical protein
MAARKKASIVIVGLPWNDENIMRGQADPLKIKEGIETIDRLMGEHGFGEGYVSVQYVYHDHTRVFNIAVLRFMQGERQDWS